MTDNFAIPPTPDTALIPDPARLAAVIRGTLIERMGIQLTELSPQRVKATMPVEGNTQPAGLLHGGASAALAETVASFGAAEHAGPGRAVVGLDLNVTHHRGVRSGHVHAVATAIHLGRTMVSYEIVITGDDGARVSSARLSCMILAER